MSKSAVKMGAVKSFQGGNHINKKVPAQFAQSPLPLESFLHIQTWQVTKGQKARKSKKQGLEVQSPGLLTGVIPALRARNPKKSKKGSRGAGA